MKFHRVMVDKFTKLIKGNIVELLAPAGNFEVAIAAFEAGADAVYLGLKSFSARKKANNFTMDELRRLKFYAQKEAKKIYITLNTLVTESELPELFRTLDFLKQINIDAVIIQDFGVLEILRTHFPSIPIHASTQMAIHSLEGARMAKHCNIERVVLARECPLAIVDEIRQEIPSLQLEVFVHGALCYSFSGLCLASGVLLDRSGNRGECAQICRTYFERENNVSSYPFSCHDLALRGEIARLQALGVSSYKIEGRMKGTDYVHSTVSYYRRVIDGKNDLVAERLLDQSAVSFARKYSYGHLMGDNGDNLINQHYAGHLGVKAGKLVGEGKKLFLAAERELALYDTLAFIRNERLISRTSFKQIEVNGKRVVQIAAGQRASFSLPEDVAAGDEVYLVAHSSPAANALDYKRFPLFKVTREINVSSNDHSLIFSIDRFSFQYEVHWIDRSGDKSLFSALSEQFKKSGESLYQLNLCIDEGAVELQKRFLSPSQIKEIRRQVYARFEKFEEERRDGLVLPSISINFKSSSAPLTRQTICLTDGMPFIQDEIDLKSESLAKWKGFLVLPLAPLSFSESDYFDAIEKFVIDHTHQPLLLGINNIAHLNLAKRLQNQPHVSFFIDYAFYLANSWSLAFALKSLPRLLFAYSWCESKEVVEGCVPLTDRLALPLFISRGCYLKLKGQQCAACERSHRELLKNGGREFEVVVKRCLTYLFLK